MKPQGIMMMFNGDETVRLSTEDGNEVTDHVIAAFYNEMQQNIESEGGSQLEGGGETQIVVVDESQNIVASSFAAFKDDDGVNLISEDLPNAVSVTTNGMSQENLIIMDENVALSLTEEALKNNKNMEIAESWKIGLLETNGVVPISTELLMEPSKEACHLWECPKCSALFNNQEACQVHVTKFHDFSCGLCSEPFHEKEALESHIIRHISEIPGHTIQMIAKPAVNATVHSALNPDEKENDATSDSNKGTSDETPQNEQGDVTNAEEQSNDVFVCSTCNLSYSSKQNLVEHEKTHVDDDSTYLPLEGGPSVVELVATDESESSSKGHQPFHCDACDKSFYTKNSLLLHMSKRHASTVNSNFVCDECGQGFKWKLSLENHLVIQHNMKKKTLPCNKCDETFSSQEDLSAHRLLHERELNPFKCDTCGEKFKQSVHLLNHVKLYHPNGQRFTCGECGKSFKIKKFLEAHVSEVHRQKSSNNKCRYCLKSFMTLNALSAHIHTHHALKQDQQFSCKICTCSFRSGAELFQHMSDHVEEAKSLQCNECGKFFSKEENLSMHLKTHKAATQTGVMDET